VFNSPVQADTVTALGAVPVNIGTSWTEEVRSGNLRGAEFDIAQYAHNGYATEAGDVTANVVLWPKVFVLSLSKKRFDSLTSQQQGWVREAAAQAVKASADASYDDSTIAQSLCITGVRFYDASAAQIAALRSKVRPVLDKLAMTTSDAALLRAIQAIARRHPTPEPLNVPADCR
jgi:TRAP-type C4-dicarboxylate transport system substrate-binding protein